MGAQPLFRDATDAKDVLHNAATVSPDSPDYEDARQAIADAVDYLEQTDATNSAADPERQINVSPLEAIGIGGFQGATSEFGDELSSIGNDDPQAMRDAARKTISAARSQHPWLTTGGEIAGSVVNPALRAGGALLKGLGRTAQGGWLGAAGGAASGAGMGEGGAEDRAIPAAIGAGVGGLVGAGIGKVIGKIEPSAKVIGQNATDAGRNLLERVKAWRPKPKPVAPKSAPSPVIGKSGPVSAADKERIVNRAASNLGGGKSAPTPGSSSQQARPAVKMDPKVQETINNARANRSATQGTGKTLPYYPRGGAAEQKVGPFPAVSPSQGPQISDDAIKTSVELARSLGQSDEQIAKLLAAKGISPDQVRVILGGS